MSEQADLEGMAVDYARPPETPPTERERKPDRLSEIARDYNDAQRSGIIEGALWVLRVKSSHEPDRYIQVDGTLTTLTDAIEAALRRRFGDEHVDREKRLHEERDR